MVSSAASFMARPSDSEFRRLQRARHVDLAHDLGMTPENLTSFKRIIGEKLRRSLDRTKQLKDQDPSVWSKFLQWAHDAMPVLAAKYENFWPVELYAKISLSKNIASDRHRFRVATEKYRLQKALIATSTRVNTSPSLKHDTETPPLTCTDGHLPVDPPPLHDALDSTTGDENSFDVDMHPDAVPEDVEEFLRSCDLDLGHLTNAFVTSRAGLFNRKRLELISMWPAALRRDHFERHFGTVLDDVEVEVLNMRLKGMNQDCSLTEQ